MMPLGQPSFRTACRTRRDVVLTLGEEALGAIANCVGGGLPVEGLRRFRTAKRLNLINANVFDRAPMSPRPCRALAGVLD